MTPIIILRQILGTLLTKHLIGKTPSLTLGTMHNLLDGSGDATDFQHFLLDSLKGNTTALFAHWNEVEQLLHFWLWNPGISDLQCCCKVGYARAQSYRVKQLRQGQLRFVLMKLKRSSPVGPKHYDVLGITIRYTSEERDSMSSNDAMTESLILVAGEWKTFISSSCSSLWIDSETTSSDCPIELTTVLFAAA